MLEGLNYRCRRRSGPQGRVIREEEKTSVHVPAADHAFAVVEIYPCVLVDGGGRLIARGRVRRVGAGA